MPERPNWAEKVTAIATAIAAIGAIAIPIVIEKNAKATRTVQTVNEAGRLIDATVSKKEEIDEKYGKENKERFTPDYIIRHRAELEPLVFRLLNEYDGLCAGVGLDVLNEEIFLRFRGGALAQSWADYHDFIIGQRAISANAWGECDAIIDRYNESQK